MRSAVLVALAALVACASAAYNSSLVSELYMNLGSLDNNPSTVNCSRYADLFTDDAILHQPGVPDVQGRDDIIQACQIDHGQINPLISFAEIVLTATSWTNEKRTAFRWTINGIHVSDGAAVYAPAIAAFFQDTDGNIEEAWSFYDDTLVQTGLGAPDPFNATGIIDAYIRLGASAAHPYDFDCKAWANLYSSSGINNEPGIPPSQGTSSLYTLCTQRVALWQTLAPAVLLQIPVMSWNREKRLAFRYTLAGQGKDGQGYVIPAITIFFMTVDGQIIESWDWWDTSLLPQ